VFATLDSGMTEAFINGTQPQLGAPATTFPTSNLQLPPAN
jgi:hypothetical protein